MAQITSVKNGIQGDSSEVETVSDGERKRLAQKVMEISLLTPQNPKITWNKSRLFTPGGLSGYRSEHGLEYVDFDESGGVKLFRSGHKSQGLISQGDQVVGASVDTSIKTATDRKHETKGTFIQYDKLRVEQEETDFTVDPTNYRGRVNYHGGHLIDYKYSAENSHTTENNYIPMIELYNTPIKEYLVRRSDAYVEIPLYTPKPPMIGVKGKRGNYHPIPVGIIFVQLKQNKIEEVYYFPNNNFNYKEFRNTLKLGPRVRVAKNVVPYFRLRKSFHQLFRSAMIVDVTHVKGGLLKQEKQEQKFFDLIDDVSWGMSLKECDKDQEMISRFASTVLHKGSVDPALCLDCDEAKMKNFEEQCEALEAPFNALGEFLVRYSIRNALKSEVLSINSRLVFLNVIIDFIEGYSQVEQEALEFVDSLADSFKSTLEELDQIAPTMNQEELFYLANIYQRLSDDDNQVFATEDCQIYDFEDLSQYFSSFIKVLEIIVKNYPIESLIDDEAWDFLEFVQQAQKTLHYLIDQGCPHAFFKKEKQFLKSIKAPCKKLDECSDELSIL